MKFAKVGEALRNIVGEARVLEGEPMKKHTTFRIGGPADWLVLPQSEESILEVLSFCRKEGVPCFPMGNGSNLLVSDQGIPGVVMKLGEGFGRIHPVKDPASLGLFCPEGYRLFYVEAGAMLSGLARFAQRSYLSGLAFAGGIPGTVGGAIRMNAGAYGGEMSQVTIASAALVWNEKLLCYERVLFQGEEQAFAYRDSVYQHCDALILGAYLLLKEEDNGEAIAASMADFQARRREKQPLELPSAGSTFKRPKGDYAARLIDACGLRGLRVGDAQVSMKHCGFVVNVGAASCRDVLELIRQIRSKVKAETNVLLETEVEIVGLFTKEP